MYSPHSDMPRCLTEVFNSFSSIQDPVKGHEPHLVFSVGRTGPQPFGFFLFFSLSFFLFFSLFSFLKDPPQLFCRTFFCIFASVWLFLSSQSGPGKHFFLLGLPHAVFSSVWCVRGAWHSSIITILSLNTWLKWVSVKFLHSLLPNNLLPHILSSTGDFY